MNHGSGWYAARPMRAHPVPLPAYLTVVPPAGYAVAPAMVGAIATAAWELREQALAELNPAELAEVDQAGSEALAVDSATLRLAAAGNVRYPPAVHPATVQEAFTAEPRGESRALIAELTAADPSCQNGWEGLYLVVLNRPVPAHPWQIAEIASICTPAKDPSLMMPSNVIDPPPPTDLPLPAARIPALVADYWQAWVDTGRPPGHDMFNAGPFTTELGKQLARDDRQDSTYRAGRLGFLQPIRQHYRFSPAYGSWTFAAQGFHGHADFLVCATIAVRARLTPTGHSTLDQAANRHGWGALLAPGRYREIDTLDVHPTCALERSNGSIDLIGGSYRPVAAWGLSA